MLKREILFKWLFYALIIWFFATLQISVLTAIKPFGVHPFIMPGLVAVFALFEGKIAGGTVGLLAGLFCDAFYSQTEGYFAIALMVLGILTGVLSVYIFDKNLISAFIWSIGTYLLVDFFYFIFFVLFPQRGGWGALVSTGFPEIGISMLLLPIVYLPIKLVSRIGINAPRLKYR